MSSVVWWVEGWADTKRGDGGVAGWLRHVRLAAGRQPLAGGLLFDGEQWLQCLQGESWSVVDLAVQLRAWPGWAVRRSSALVAFDGDALGAWRCGYVDPDTLESLSSTLTACADPASAAQRFAQALDDAGAL